MQYLSGDNMKKIILTLFFITIIATFINEKENIFIPSDAIRFRIIASSNEEVDQNLKLEIKDKVENALYKVIGNTNNIIEVRELINNNLDIIDNIIKDYDISYQVSFGNNYFPKKIYKGITYEEGNYESLVITLGSGKGKNWWCVLFPPLCLLDEQSNLEDAEYELYARKLINNFKQN